MWVLLLLGLLPLAVLPTMFGNGPQDGDASDDGDHDWAGAAPSGGPSGGDGPSEGVWPADGDDPDPDAGPDPDPDPDPSPDPDPDPGADDPPPFQPATFVLAPGDATATFAGFVPGADRVEVHVDPGGPPADVTSGQDGSGSWVRVTQGDAVAHAVFPDLADPPVGDVHLVTEPIGPDTGDDEPGGADDGGEAPLAPVTDDTDTPGTPDDAPGPVLAPVVPAEGAP